MIHFNLKKHLKEKDITISELSEKTGISRNSLGLLINGKSRGIQFDTLEKIARVIDIKIEDLFLMSFDNVDIVASNMEIRDSDLGKNYNASYDMKNLNCYIDIDGDIHDFNLNYQIDLKLNVLKDGTSELNVKIDKRKFDFLKLFLPINNEIDSEIRHLTYVYLINTIIQINKKNLSQLHKDIPFSLNQITYEIIQDAFTVSESGILKIKDFYIVEDNHYSTKINDSGIVTYIKGENKITFTSLI
ncbi:hypothetical protein ASS95_01495 [Staphylococcus equorum]|uniref:helix-turn-helix domain-containing protein n=1 Tax=Staphylococcus equorum TaxID=246432 RepID=UPI000853DDDC|nr:helix-turn-helix transcriptional regulator [Staphylococcus equorum]OEK55459.1 hypothetical protein ASS95_01495 [Staphylococcus equorum]